MHNELSLLGPDIPGMNYLSRKVLARAGFAVARDFYQSVISNGGKITYYPDSFSSTGAPVKSGRRMVTFSTHQKGTISYMSLSSFPLNLFERGRTLRSGTREGGRYILRSYRGRFIKLATDTAAEALKDILDEYERKGGIGADFEKIIRREVHSNGLGPGTNGSSAEGGLRGGLFGIEAEWKR